MRDGCCAHRIASCIKSINLGFPLFEFVVGFAYRLASREQCTTPDIIEFSRSQRFGKTVPTHMSLVTKKAFHCASCLEHACFAFEKFLWDCLLRELWRTFDPLRELFLLILEVKCHFLGHSFFYRDCAKLFRLAMLVIEGHLSVCQSKVKSTVMGVLLRKCFSYALAGMLTRYAVHESRTTARWTGASMK